MEQTATYECAQCDTEFPVQDVHTEIVRRDFVEVPQPLRIERLCGDCWKAYVTDFLGRDFESVLEGYDAAD